MLSYLPFGLSADRSYIEKNGHTLFSHLNDREGILFSLLLSYYQSILVLQYILITKYSVKIFS